MRDRIDEHPVRKVERQIVRESELWKSRNPVAGADRGPVKRGVGFAQSVWYRFVSMNSSAEVRVHKDGSLEVLSAVQDIGSGIKTVMAQIVAEQFGVPPEKISVKVGDTNYPGGSELRRQHDHAFAHACRSRRRMAGFAEVSGGDRSCIRHDRPGTWNWWTARFAASPGRCKPVSFKRAAAKMKTDQIAVQSKRVPDYDRSKYLTYGGVDVAEVEVDTETRPYPRQARPFGARLRTPDESSRR